MISSAFLILVLSNASTYKRYPNSVGTRPAEVCGLANTPMLSSSAIRLRMVAGLTDSAPEFAIAFEPTGWPSRIWRSTNVISNVCFLLLKSIIVTDSRLSGISSQDTKFHPTIKVIALLFFWTVYWHKIKHGGEPCLSLYAYVILPRLKPLSSPLKPALLY